MTERELSPALLLLFEMLLAALPVFVFVFDVPVAVAHTLLHVFDLLRCIEISHSVRIDFCKLRVGFVADERLLDVSGVFVSLVLNAVGLALYRKLCALGDPGDGFTVFFSAGTAGENAKNSVSLCLVFASLSWTVHFMSLQYFAPQLQGDRVLPRKQRRHLSSPYPMGNQL